MKMGIIGAGMIVHSFLEFAHELKGLELPAICGTPQGEDKLKELCRRYV
ncbi:hypothetical protein AALB39_19290 [Lachnospiraceae bacterium 54-53]